MTRTMMTTSVISIVDFYQMKNYYTFHKNKCRY